MRYVLEEAYKETHKEQDGNNAGIARVTKAQHGENLDENVANMVERIPIST